MTSNETFELLSQCEQQTYAFGIAELKLIFRNQTNAGLIRKFNEAFKKDDDGKQRNWPDIEEPKIKEIFDKCKARVIVLLEEFKKLALPKSITQQEAETPGENDNNSFEVNTFIQKNPSGIKRSSTITNSKILSEEEINKVRDKFLEDIDFSYEEAIARHVSKLTKF